MNRNYHELVAQKRLGIVPSGFRLETISDGLFDFQKAIVKWAVAKGKAAIFADTGLGKTAMQCEWSKHVADFTKGTVLILAPLCVSLQTVQEGKKFGIDVRYLRKDDGEPGIIITNYEMMEHFDFSRMSGIVLDESSILKSQDGKTRKRILELSQHIPFRLSCTATPSPNDFMELGNQCEFLGIMSSKEMLAMFFTHDGGETSKWRLKGHAKTKFWEWMATWSVCIRNPADLGFDGSKYDLPPLNIIPHITQAKPSGTIFAMPAETLTERIKARKLSVNDRVNACADLVNNSDEPWIVWCNLNAESELLEKAVKNSKAVSGSDSISKKEETITSFISGELPVLITKASIAGFGLNLQHCHNMAFVGITDSFEDYYQAIRRCYRFGQTKPVNVHLFLSDAEILILENLKRKESQHREMSTQMVQMMGEIMQKEITGTVTEKTSYERDVIKGNRFELHLADCVDLASEIETNSIDYTIFSPPFGSLYTYSNSEYDMGNVKDDDEFFKQFDYLVQELYRITAPGRLLSFHCMNLPMSKQNFGEIGIRDFRGDLIRLFVNHGFIYHSEVVIWKDPVIAMQRTKALGLLYKQIKKDSAMSRQGIPDYLVTMRKPGINQKPVTHDPEEFPVGLWQRYASPVWMDINPSKTLNRDGAREEDDERHICPLQLEVIERAIELWTLPDDLVFSPFTGIGSEGYVAIQKGRRFLGSELKRSYFDLAVKNLEMAHKRAPTLFKDESSYFCDATAERDAPESNVARSETETVSEEERAGNVETDVDRGRKCVGRAIE